MTGIIDLRQTAENNWKARYQGNYGIYTIKITTEGKEATEFFCSCPSGYYPCKHIDMVQEAIAEQIAINKKLEKRDGLQPEDFLRNVSVEKLRDFIVIQSKYIPELYNAILLEFSADAENAKGNKYSKVIQKVMSQVTYYDEDDYYSEEYQDIDILDQWIDKASSFLSQKQYDEAILICKALIEEYSQWLYNAGDEKPLQLSSKYPSIIFDIMTDAVRHVDKKELFNYCFVEIKKKKYLETGFYDHFHLLLANLAVTVDPNAFITLQDELLASINDLTSHKTKVILQRKINFYRQLNQDNKAWDVIEKNIQIDSFRYELVEKKINEKDFSAAKKLIYDFFDEQKKDEHRYIGSNWNKLLLEIAQKEKDIPAIQKLAYGFIENHFNKQYYEIYKAAFKPDEWTCEYEKLFQHYCEGKYFNSSAANLLTTENDASRLMTYIEKYLSADILKSYYKFFENTYPEKTLEMFKQVLTSYANNNVGRSHYEFILSMLRKMSQIKGGMEAASDLANGFRTQYKNRRAMIETLKRF